MPDPKPIEKRKQLIVEGDDARYFFGALLRRLRLRGIQVQNFGGISEFRDFLDALISTPGFRELVVSLGIVRDAEGNPQSAFQSIRDALRNVGFAVLSQPEVSAGNDPKVSVLILPNANSRGMLETICLQSVASNAVMVCVDQYFTCVRQQTGSVPRKLDKAKVGAFLASRPKPHLLLGQASYAGYWDWNSPAFDHVKAFLRSL